MKFCTYDIDCVAVEWDSNTNSTCVLLYVVPEETILAMGVECLLKQKSLWNEAELCYCTPVDAPTTAPFTTTTSIPSAPPTRSGEWTNIILTQPRTDNYPDETIEQLTSKKFDLLSIFFFSKTKS